MDSLWGWVVFNAFVLAMLALDLGVFHRRPHAVSLKEASLWSAAWIALAIVFGLGVHRWMGSQAGVEYFAGYLIEKSLSVDNIFVFVLIFSYFRVPAAYQHRVLFWGILGALVMRGAMIGAGAYLISRFDWVVYVLGAFLVFTGGRLAMERERSVEPEKNPMLRLVRRLWPITHDFRGANFFVRDERNGRVRAATPLFVVLVLVETTDLIFAVDSIPAIFAVTRDPFLVYTSNVFAILGLRSLYFVLAGVVERFHYLRLGLALVLVFVGVKMLLSDVYHVPIGWSLGVIGATIGLSIGASLRFPPKSAERKPAEETAEASSAEGG